MALGNGGKKIFSNRKDLEDFLERRAYFYPEWSKRLINWLAVSYELPEVEKSASIVLETTFPFTLYRADAGRGRQRSGAGRLIADFLMLIASQGSIQVFLPAVSYQSLVDETCFSSKN